MRPREFNAGEQDSSDSFQPTRLYCLEPFGMGTPHVEGLDSFLIRLSAAHCVSPRDLIRYELVPNDSALRGTLQSNFSTRYARTINGLGPYAFGLSSVLNRLTGRSDLQKLTLLPLKSIFTANGASLLSNTKRWCPACIAEHRLHGREAFRPLLWSLDLFTACPTHGLPLSAHCPKCRRTQPHVPDVPLIDACMHCGAYLGLQVVKDAADYSEVRVAQELVALLGASSFKSPLANLRANLGRLISQQFAGSRTAFAKHHGLKPDSFKNWFYKPSLPALPQLMEIAIKLGIPAKVLVSASGKLNSTDPVPIKQLSDRKARAPVKSNKADTESALICQLCGLDEPPTLVDAAAQLNLTAAALRYRYPSESSALIQARAKYLQGVREKRIANIDGAILAAMNTLTSSGRSVSRKRVDLLLADKKLSLWQPYVRARWRLLRKTQLHKYR